MLSPEPSIWRIATASVKIYIVDAHVNVLAAADWLTPLIYLNTDEWLQGAHFARFCKTKGSHLFRAS